MFADPEPLDEDDPEVMEDLFEQSKFLGKSPQDLPGLTDKQRKEYGAYLQKEMLA
jgi:hypothetical protein